LLDGMLRDFRQRNALHITTEHDLDYGQYRQRDRETPHLKTSKITDHTLEMNAN
jgi:hypothetical protein